MMNVRNMKKNITARRFNYFKVYLLYNLGSGYLKTFYSVDDFIVLIFSNIDIDGEIPHLPSTRWFLKPIPHLPSTRW